MVPRFGGAWEVYLAREREEVDGNWAAAASCQYAIFNSCCTQGNRFQMRHVRLVLCQLQALEELQAHGRRRLWCLRIRIRCSLHTRDPLSASVYAMFRDIVASVLACIVGVGRDVAHDKEGSPVEV